MHKVMETELCQWAIFESSVCDHRMCPGCTTVFHHQNEVLLFTNTLLVVLLLKCVQLCTYLLVYICTHRGCVHNIFGSLSCKSKGEHLWNKESCVLFHFKSSFRSWDIQIYVFRYSSVLMSSNSQAWKAC